jgi:hypothetical protein
MVGQEVVGWGSVDAGMMRLGLGCKGTNNTATDSNH